MPVRRHWDKCQDCQKKSGPKRPISKRGLCEECGTRRFVDAATALKTKTGPEWEAWKAGMAAALEAQP